MASAKPRPASTETSPQIDVSIAYSPRSAGSNSRAASRPARNQSPRLRALPTRTREAAIERRLIAAAGSFLTGRCRGDLSRGVAPDHGARRHRPGHDGARGDDGAVPDRAGVLEDSRPRGHPYTVADHELAAQRLRARVAAVIVGVDVHVVRKGAACADRDTAREVELAAAADPGVGAD